MKRKSPRYFANLMKSEPYSKNVKNWRRKKSEQLFGVPPELIPNYKVTDGIYEFELKKSFVVHKSSKKGQNSFRVTKSLLDSLIETSIQIQKKPTLIITITDGSDEYTLTCSITKK